MLTLRDIFMMLSPAYKQRMMEQYARSLNNYPVPLDQNKPMGAIFPNDANPMTLENMFRMNPKYQMLMNQWDSENKPLWNRVQTGPDLRQLMNMKPPPKYPDTI